jgi:Restriction endonuclease
MDENFRESAPVYAPPRHGDFGLSLGEISELQKKRADIKYRAKKGDENSTKYAILSIALTIFSCIAIIYQWLPIDYSNEKIYPYIFFLPCGVFIFSIFLFPSAISVFSSHPKKNEKLNTLEQYEKATATYISEFTKKENAYNKRLQEFNLEKFRKKSEYWMNLGGLQYEYEIGNLFRRAGYTVTVTKPSRDEGIDIIAWNSKEKIIIQCKAHKKPIGPAVVRELYGAFISAKADRAILITLVGATKGAFGFIEGKPVEIWTIQEIIRMNANSSPPTAKG